MKICLVFFLILPLFAFAKQYGVYDSQGNQVSKFDAKQHELPEKAQLIKEMYPNRSLYISSVSKSKSSKPLSRYRYKAETGAYIEASRKETFSVCPDKEIHGTWVSEYSVSLNAENCISIQAPDLAGTFHMLFLQNSGRTDTIQVLVEQSYIQMGDYSHSIWVPDSMPSFCKTRTCIIPPYGHITYGHYENKKYNQSLIVDKTKFTMADAQYYCKNGDVEIPNLKWETVYPKSENLEDSQRPYISHNDFMFANARSKEEGFDTVYHVVDMRNRNKDTEKFVFLGDKDSDRRYILAVDTSASGYRLPLEDEWFFLMRAGASTHYYWGDEEDSLAVFSYAWVRPIGLKPVAQLIPNKFGLYDMIGLAYERYISLSDELIGRILGIEKYKGMNEVKYCGGKPECIFISEIGAFEQYMGMPDVIQICDRNGCLETEQKPILKIQRANYTSFRLLRKTSKLHKLDKF